MSHQRISALVTKHVLQYEESFFLQHGTLPTEVALCDDCLAGFYREGTPAAHRRTIAHCCNMKVIPGVLKEQCVVHRTHTPEAIHVKIHITASSLTEDQKHNIGKAAWEYIEKSAKMRQIPLRLSGEE